MTPDPDFTAWIQRARDADIRATAEMLGARLKKAGAAEHAGACPRCGGDDRFSVNTRERVFNCRGALGGDVIAMVQHVRGCEFVDACEIILDEPRPGRSAPIDPEIARERQKELREEQRARAKAARTQEEREMDEAIAQATKLFNCGSPIAATRAEDYLEARGISISPELSADLRFLAHYPYRGFATKDAISEVELGRYHCMLAAIRDINGRIIGVHRTYLDKTGARKLKCPGDARRNKAKKIFQKVKGGLIRLGPIGDTLAIGEGIETTLSWLQLARAAEFGEEFCGVSVACAVSLGNMSGGADGSRPHPSKKDKDGKPTPIASGVPDMDKPGMLIPGNVKRLVLLGDGDSDPAETRARLLTGAERFRRAGVEVLVSFAPTGLDWNDVILARESAAA